jgi:hypothetical protein
MNIFHQNINARQLCTPPLNLAHATQPLTMRQNCRCERVQKVHGDERTKKNRKIIASILKHFGQKVGSKLSLCNKGICYFQFNQFVIGIEVPADSESFFFHSMVFGLRPTSDRLAILESCMQLNYMKQATRGSTLGLDGDEVNLCWSSPVIGVTRESFVEALENFILTAVEVHEQLIAVK